MTTDTDVLVIGAGPAGLTASYLLTKAGKRVTVIERDPSLVGGISRTVNYKGFLFDIGGHRFFSKSKEVVDLWKELLPDDFIERPRMSRIYYRGKFYSYPLRAFEALWNLGLLRSALPGVGLAIPDAGHRISHIAAPCVSHAVGAVVVGAVLPPRRPHTSLEPHGP